MSFKYLSFASVWIQINPFHLLKNTSTVLNRYSGLCLRLHVSMHVIVPWFWCQLSFGTRDRTGVLSSDRSPPRLGARSASGLMCCKARVRAARVPRGFARTGSAANDSGFVEGDGCAQFSCPAGGVWSSPQQEWCSKWTLSIGG